MRVPDLLQVEADRVRRSRDEERDALSRDRPRRVRADGRDAQERRGVAAEPTSPRACRRSANCRRGWRRIATRSARSCSPRIQQRVAEIAAQAGRQVVRGADRAGSRHHGRERGDIAEELTRLTHHVEQTEKAIDGEGAAGKKLDFLSQEMLREINTMGSKSRSAAIRTLVVELKTEVERIREQVQNVE